MALEIHQLSTDSARGHFDGDHEFEVRLSGDAYHGVFDGQSIEIPARSGMVSIRNMIYTMLARYRETTTYASAA